MNTTGYFITSNSIVVMISEQLSYAKSLF